MNRRVRTHCRSSSSKDEGFQRYLKPGALAQLRNSRINSRSQRPDLHSQISLYRSSSLLISSATETNFQTQISTIDGFPCFSGRIYSPRFPQRKKLVASKSVFFLNSSPSSPLSGSSDSVMDVLNTEIFVSH
ncbi:hypothetical protein BVC80_205g5 [Macleaya cordata]|uniref:Uncharacterized protein n=1 Tax=Macleaya cordata TaxID=56857 RepID=A0A200PYV4_MACCD|nr:hypothetical protein BVC80_205g5 [Macleaya cordata]